MLKLNHGATLLSISRFMSVAKRHPWIEPNSALSDEETVLTYLAGNAAAGNLNNLTTDWSFLPESHHDLGIEVVLQTHLNIGTPRIINALATLREYHSQKFATNWDDLYKMSTEQLENPEQIGQHVMTQIYGEKVCPRVVDKLRSLHPKLAQWTLQYAYGTVYSRNRERTDMLKLRELCTVVALAGLNVTPQLVSHIRGALRVGATRDQVKQVIDQTHLIWGDEAQAQALAVWYTFERSRSGL
jgi:alkylhydroperoxidase/carboxymuconolactone decarboxylase family protein YurZ